MIIAGLERVREEGDDQGNVVLKELPVDMKEDADRDFVATIKRRT